MLLALLPALLLAACTASTAPVDDTASGGTASTDTASTDTASTDGGTSSTDGGTSSTDGGSSAALLPELPTSGCGLPAYDWLALDQVGQLVSVEEASDLSYDVDTINQILTLLDLGQLTPVPYGVRAWRVRYRTQDKGQPIEATGYLALPDVDSAVELPIMLWNHPTTGFYDACAPTNLGIIGGAYPLLMAAHGFAVAAPDYLGMAGIGEPSGVLHPWIVAEPTAVVALDSVRALLRFLAEESATYGIVATADPARTVIFGASEGGFASLWADRYQPEYLPEVEVTGVIAAIPATDPLALATLGATTTSATTTAITAALTSMADWYDTDAPLSEVLQPPFDQTVPEAMATTCEGWDEVFQAAEDPGDILAADYLAVASAGGDWSEAYEPWSCFLAEGVLRESEIERRSDAPVLVVTGETDVLAWPGPTHDDIGPLCDQGMVIEHVYCAGEDHVGAAVAALPMMIGWALQAGEGSDPTAGAGTCTLSEPVDCTTLR